MHDHRTLVVAVVLSLAGLVATARAAPPEPTPPPPPPAVEPAPAAPPPAPPPAPAPEVAPAPPPPPPAPPPSSRAPAPPPAAHRAWYTDTLGDALLGGGVVLTTIAIIEYGNAVSGVDSADQAPTLAAYNHQLASARTEHNVAITLGVVGVAAIVAGCWHYTQFGKDSRSGVAVVPTKSGGFVTWSGGF